MAVNLVAFPMQCAKTNMHLVVAYCLGMLGKKMPTLNKLKPMDISIVSATLWPGIFKKELVFLLLATEM